MQVEKLKNYIMGLGVYEKHQAYSIAHDSLLHSDDPPKQFVYAKSRSIDYLRHKTFYNRVYMSVSVDDDESDFLETYDVKDESYVMSERVKEQRQLISSLLSDADDLTTAIVRHWLDCEKPTLTSIASQLGIHHETVRRKLTRLTRKYDEKVFGDFRDYLSA